MNQFINFFTAFFALFTGLFSASKGRERKINTHNQEAYQKLREKLLPYAKQFILPVCKRDNNRVLIKNKKVLKYEKTMASRKRELLLMRGHKLFKIGDEVFSSLNFKNAVRKYGLGVVSLGIA